jgi:hypothetical protein
VCLLDSPNEQSGRASITPRVVTLRVRWLSFMRPHRLIA